MQMTEQLEAEELQIDKAYLKWLGISQNQYEIDVYRLEEKQRISHYSSVHSDEYIRAIDEYHADYSGPREQYERKKWVSYQQYLDWKKANPEPLSAEMQRLKEVGDLLERCYLNWDAYLSFAPEYKKAFFRLLDYDKLTDEQKLRSVLDMTKAEQCCWNDLVTRQKQWAYDNDPDYRHHVDMKYIDCGYDDYAEVEADNERDEAGVDGLYPTN
jgi:hypothetical protein